MDGPAEAIERYMIGFAAGRRRVGDVGQCDGQFVEDRVDRPPGIGQGGPVVGTQATLAIEPVGYERPLRHQQPDAVLLVELLLPGSIDFRFMHECEVRSDILRRLPAELTQKQQQV